MGRWGTGIYNCEAKVGVIEGKGHVWTGSVATECLFVTYEMEVLQQSVCSSGSFVRGAVATHMSLWQSNLELGIKKNFSKNFIPIENRIALDVRARHEVEVLKSREINSDFFNFRQ